MPAVARLDRRQEAFAIRPASTTPGPHTELLRAKTGLGQRVGRLVGPEGGVQKVEASRVGLGRSFPGDVTLEIPPAWKKEEKEERAREAMEEAIKKELDPNTIWTDGSRLDNGTVGAGVAWYEEVVESERGMREKVRGGVSVRPGRERKGREALSIAGTDHLEEHSRGGEAEVSV